MIAEAAPSIRKRTQIACACPAAGAERLTQGCMLYGCRRLFCQTMSRSACPDTLIVADSRKMRQRWWNDWDFFFIC